MKYSLSSLQINNFSVFAEKRLPHRSYFIPYSDVSALKKQTALSLRRNSDIVTLLSGEDWGFKFYEKISRLPSVLDTDFVSFDTISVPSVWQRKGYEKPNYLNVRYPFVVSYPNVPNEMSCGVYRKLFSISEETKHTIITFLGVCSCISLYVNGVYVGYSEGSHNMAEFNLDGVVHEGENEMIVLVTKWCNGTYLECQDMFRDNGIFRDVYLSQHKGSYVWDYTITTSRNSDTYELSAEFDFSDTNIRSAEVSLYDGDKLLASSVCNVKGKKHVVDFGALDVRQWSAESPILYDLYITCTDGKNSESFKTRVGFKTVSIVGDIFLFNDKKIKFKGVNHHDTNMKNGFVMTAEELLRDVQIMKEFNCNAVRTSHYPPDPVFLDLCDEYGLYVILEADIETHGTQFDETHASYLKKANRLSNDKQWLPRYMDRVEALFERDKNHCCITMWSLGNESGGWKNQDKCYEWLKRRSPLPVHYEAVIRTVRGSYDVVSEMYQHPFLLKKIAKNQFVKRYNGKPYFLCEYCHAMGLGPGSLEDYWEIIYSSDKMTGGCIWEFADHAFYDENAKYKLTYGGDHDEERHDGNFCVDGLFFPDRTPHSGAYEMKAVYRPIRAKRISDNIYSFRNTNSFTNASEYSVTYDILKNGTVCDSGEVELSAAPGETQSIVIAHDAIDDNHDYYINFTYRDKNGTVVAVEQLLMNTVTSKLKIDRSGVVKAEKDRHLVTITTKKGRLVFDKDTGVLKELYSGSKMILADDDGFVFNIFRAPIDNDRNKESGWKKLGYTDAVYVPKKFSGVDEKSDCVTVKTTGELRSHGKKLFDTSLKIKVYPDGNITVIPKIAKSPFTPKMSLPRFGVNLRLVKDFQNVTYYGFGDENGLGECLSDFCQHSRMGIYTTTVEQMFQPYIKPQENGMHIDTKKLTLSSSNGLSLSVRYRKAPFIFSVRNCSNKSLINAAHIEDVTDAGYVTLNIDGFMRGAGSNSCGPDVLEPYKVHIKDELKFSFYLSL